MTMDYALITILILLASAAFVVGLLFRSHRIYDHDRKVGLRQDPRLVIEDRDERGSVIFARLVPFLEWHAEQLDLAARKYHKPFKSREQVIRESEKTHRLQQIEKQAALEKDYESSVVSEIVTDIKEARK
jgi:hypothetical protein